MKAPAKLKGAVSACIGDCAGAVLTDFGLVATEKGWNIFVGGKGGSAPIPGRLLAKNLNRAETIKILDRFFAYFIRTAGKRVNTAIWLDGMEGGIRRLREILIDDVLEIGSELEAEIKPLLNVENCPWQTAIHQPERLNVLLG